MAKEYAVYKGDAFVCTGTCRECAEHLQVKPETIRWYATPSYRKVLAKRMKSGKALQVFVVDGEEE